MEGGAAPTVRTSEGSAVRAVADSVLVTVDCKPRTEGWGLEAMAVDMAAPFVRIDGRCRTSMRDVWAIGDLVGEPMLAHKASAQSEMVAEIISGVRRQFDPVAIPAVCFTDTEIVSVDLNPADANEPGTELIVAQFPFAANGRTLTMEAGGRRLVCPSGRSPRQSSRARRTGGRRPRFRARRGVHLGDRDGGAPGGCCWYTVGWHEFRQFPATRLLSRYFDPRRSVRPP